MEIKDGKSIEEERNIENNANNIRNAASVAMASGNPYAMAAGSAIKVGDKLTNGKVSEAGGKALNTLNKHNPLGNQVQNASNKLNESGASNAIGNAASLKSGGNSGNVSDTAKQKLAQNKSNRSNNAPKKKSGGLGKRLLSGLGGNDETSESEIDTTSEEQDNILVKMKKIKRILIILAPVIGIFLIIMVVISIVGTIGNFFYWGSSSNGDATIDGTKENKNEKKYYEKLDKVVEDYQKSCGFEISKSYIHMVLVYKYDDYEDAFSGDFTEIDLNDESSKVNYDDLINNVDTVAGLITSKSSCTMPDYNIPEDLNNIPKGSFYGNLRDSSFFKTYYRDKLKDKSKDDLLYDIFTFGGIGNDMENPEDEIDQFYIADDLKVDKNGDILPFGDYIKGEVYGVLPDSIISTLSDSSASVDTKTKSSNSVKAYTVAVTTNTLLLNGYEIGDMELTSNVSNNTYCDMNLGCYVEEGTWGLVYYSGGTNKSSQYNKKSYNGMYYYKAPLSENDPLRKTINSVYDSVEGNVLYKDKELVSVDTSKLADVISGDSYNNMLTSAYSGVTIKNASEDDYTYNVDFGNEYVKVSAVFYDQNDYSNAFCGRKDGGTIKTSGCGTTSMAIVASTLVSNNKELYGPVAMMKEAQSMKACGPGIDGTNESFFKKEAQKLKLNYQYVSKSGNLNTVLKALRTGKSLVIIRVGKGMFTSGGHYMVLGGINGNKVYVYDPYNRVNANSKRKSGNGWYDFNTIAKQTKSFHIMTKKS